MAEPRAADVHEDRSFVRGSLLRFLLLSAATLVILSLAIVFESRSIARDEAIRDAEVRTAGIANGIAAPQVTAGLRAGRPAAVAALGRVLENRMRDGSVAHVHVWGEDGRLLWSDLPGQVGDRFTLPLAVHALFGTTDEIVRAESDARAPEDVGIEEESLLVVHVGAVGDDGRPFVLQGYFTPERIEVDADAIFAELLPLGVGALLLFQLAVLPLAYSLARRVERGRRQRMEILNRSIASWHHERRRLAQDLHDGVIQNLSAASYTLPPVLDRLPDDPESRRAREAGEQIGEILQRDLVALRSLVMDLLPPDLAGPGLAAALEELARGMVDSGVRVQVRTDPGLSLGDDVAGVVYRVVREGLRNVARHAGATEVDVDVAASRGTVTVQVTDDGRGPTHAVSARGEHVGLRLLNGLLADVGGILELRAGERGGAVLEARLPAVLPT